MLTEEGELVDDQQSITQLQPPTFDLQERIIMKRKNPHPLLAKWTGVTSNRHSCQFDLVLFYLVVYYKDLSLRLLIYVKDYELFKSGKI